MAAPASMTVLGWSDIDFTPVSIFSSFQPAPVPAIGEQVARVLAFVREPEPSLPVASSIFRGISSYLDRASSSEPLPPIGLLSTGCRVPSTDHNSNLAGKKSCAYACSSPLLHQDSATIWNCAVLSAVMLLSQAELIRLDADSRRRVNRSPLDIHYGPVAMWDMYHPATKVAGQDGVVEEDLDGVEGGWEFYSVYPHIILPILADSMRASCQQTVWDEYPPGGYASLKAVQAPMSCSPEVLSNIRAIDLWGRNTTAPRTNIAPATALAVVRSLQFLMRSYCDGAPKPSGSSDLAGPGILISAAIQTALWLALFVTLRIFTSWAAIASFPVFAFQSIRVPHNEKPIVSAWSRARALQGRLSSARLARSLIPAAVDLHETQLFLTLAIQTAIIAADTVPAPKVDVPQTHFYASHLVDFAAKVLAGMNGALPVLLASLVLYGGSQRPPLPSRRWGFHTVCLVFVAAGIAWGLASAILMTSTSSNTPPPVYLQPDLFGEPGLYPLCGLEHLQGTGNRLRGVLFYAIGTAYPVVPALLFQLLVTYLVSRGRSDGELHRLGTYGVGLAGWLKRRAEEKKERGWIFCWKAWMGIVEGVWAIMELGVAFFAVLNLVEIVRLLTVIDLGQKVWTAGQLIAMGAVWGPGLWRLLNVCLFGIEKALEPRLPADYQVVKFEAGTEVDDGLDLFSEAGSPLLGPEVLSDEDIEVLGPTPILLTEKDMGMGRDEYTDDV